MYTIRIFKDNCKVIEYLPKGIYDHELDEQPYEIIFEGSMADCYAYILADIHRDIIVEND